MTITMSNKDIHSGNLILVNAKYPMLFHDETSHVPVAGTEVLLCKEAEEKLQLIFEAIDSKGEIVPVSGYRSESEQTEIFAKSLLDYGGDFTQKYVAFPKHSEHQTGLAIDLGIRKENIDFIRPDFPYDGICEEFRKLAPRYGFVERYPKLKEHITGISHEPWHFRYVGYPHSEMMQCFGLTLEEYIDFLKYFAGCRNYLRWLSGDNAFRVFYAKADTGETTTIELPDGYGYVVSGNNTDGFIVTLWRKKDERKDAMVGHENQRDPV